MNPRPVKVLSRDLLRSLSRTSREFLKYDRSEHHSPHHKRKHLTCDPALKPRHRQNCNYGRCNDLRKGFWKPGDWEPVSQLSCPKEERF